MKSNFISIDLHFMKLKCSILKYYCLTQIDVIEKLKQKTPEQKFFNVHLKAQFVWLHSSNSFHNLVSTTYQRCHICWVFVCDFYVCSDITFVIFNKSSNSIEKMAKILSLDIQLKFFRRKSSPSPRATKKKHEHVSNQQITACHRTKRMLECRTFLLLVLSNGIGNQTIARAIPLIVFFYFLCRYIDTVHRWTYLMYCSYNLFIFSWPTIFFLSYFYFLNLMPNSHV